MCYPTHTHMLLLGALWFVQQRCMFVQGSVDFVLAAPLTVWHYVLAALACVHDFRLLWSSLLSSTAVPAAVAAGIVFLLLLCWQGTHRCACIFTVIIRWRGRRCESRQLLPMRRLQHIQLPGLLPRGLLHSFKCITCLTVFLSLPILQHDDCRV